MITAHPATWDDPAVAALREAQQAELATLYGGPDPGWDMVSDGILAVVLLRDGAEPVACGALRDAAGHGPGTAEVKRMYVVPSHRGQGLSRRVLDELEATAGALGLTRLILETGPHQPAAIGLYLSAGFLPIDRFPPYQDDTMSRAFAKELGVARRVRAASVPAAGLVVDRVGWDDETTVALRRRMAETLRGLYGAVGWFADDESVAATDAAEAGRALVVLVVRDGGAPVGTVTLSGTPEGRPAGWGELERLLVLPEARGRGVARLLLREVEDEARARGLATLTLSTGYRQHPAVALYLSAGYRVVAPVGDWERQDRLLWFAKAL